MPTASNGSRCQQVLLETIQRESRDGTVSFNPVDVMRAAVQTLDAQADEDLRQAILYGFNDLLRTGVIGLGETKKLDPKSGTDYVGKWPHGVCHVTPDGLETLKRASRDPINRPGYLAYLDHEAPLDSVTRGYVEEALNTYRACCYKATAVLIGAAIEHLVLVLRDELVHRLKARRATVAKGLEVWQVKTILEAIAKQILPDLAGDARKKPSDESLRNLVAEAQARLQPTAAEFRKIRNDAGHPASLDPVKPADVHANLLLFPSTAKLLLGLTKWVADYYT
jgi:hypothetical protein